MGSRVDVSFQRYKGNVCYIEFKQQELRGHSIKSSFKVNKSGVLDLENCFSICCRSINTLSPVCLCLIKILIENFVDTNKSYSRVFRSISNNLPRLFCKEIPRKLVAPFLALCLCTYFIKLVFHAVG